MRKDFFPDREPEMLSWSANFASKLSADPQAYSITPQTAAEYAALHQAFADAYHLASAPSTSTRSAVQGKRDARKAMERMARSLAARIKAAPNVSIVQKVELGLNPRHSGGRGRPGGKPATAPVLQIRSVFAHRVTLSLIDPQSPTRRARPDDAGGAAIFYQVDGHPRPAAWSFLTQTTRTRLTVNLHRAAATGALKVYLAACWLGSRNQAGPMGAPVGTRLLEGVEVSALKPARAA